MLTPLGQLPFFVEYLNAACSSLAVEKHGAAKARVIATPYAQRGPAVLRL
jgi:hypothetical protein